MDRHGELCEPSRSGIHYVTIRASKKWSLAHAEETVKPNRPCYAKEPRAYQDFLHCKIPETLDCQPFAV